MLLCTDTERTPKWTYLFTSTAERRRRRERNVLEKHFRGGRRKGTVDQHRFPYSLFSSFPIFRREKKSVLEEAEKKFRGISWQRATKTESSKIIFLFLFRSADQKKWEEMGFIHFRLLLLRGIPIFLLFFFSLLLWAGPTTSSSSSHYITNPRHQRGAYVNPKRWGGAKAIRVGNSTI